jgi:RHS repeat-associated protein
LASKAIGFGENPVNRIKFQKQEFTADLALDWDEFKYRRYDPQIARFLQVDPLSDKYAYNSTYDFSEDKVISNVELEGLEAVGFDFNPLWHAAGISSSTDPKEYVNNYVIKPAVEKSIEIDKAAGIQLGIMFLTGGLGELSQPELMASKASTTAAADATAVRSMVIKPIEVEIPEPKPAEIVPSKVEKVVPSKVEKSKTIENVGTGQFTKTTEVKPSKVSPGQSRAEYVRYKNKDGKVIKTYKDSYDRGNNYQGRKPLRGGPEGRPQ